ncbi:RTA1 like protein-domain-containing protein [Pilaira anomala]|nr:RTA1 like protein-domain-containing protein [Pilaira anomala]
MSTSREDFFNMKGVDRTMQLFHYKPNKPLAYTGMAIYAAFTLFLVARVYRSKSPKFLYILAFTALMETIGYGIRIACADFTDLGRFVGMTLFLLLAPNALALVNYKAVGEIIRLSNVETDKFYLRPKFVTWFFFGSDIFSFVLQGAGGGMQSTISLNSVGIAITLVGLGVQLFFFASFACITIYVHRSSKYNYYVEGRPNAKTSLIWCLYVTIVLLYIRSIYRVAEYATGYGGPIARLEWAFYVFDGLIIAISFLVYCIFFIGDYLPKGGDQTQVPSSQSSLSQSEKAVVQTNEVC